MGKILTAKGRRSGVDQSRANRLGRGGCAKSEGTGQNFSMSTRDGKSKDVPRAPANTDGVYAATTKEQTPSSAAALELLIASPWPQPSRWRETQGPSQIPWTKPTSRGAIRIRRARTEVGDRALASLQEAVSVARHLGSVCDDFNQFSSISLGKWKLGGGGWTYG